MLVHIPAAPPLLSSEFIFHAKMKNFASIRCISVLVLFVVVVVITHNLWGVVQDARKLSQTVRAWQAAGHHTTLMGKVRERLATAWWMGPLRLASPRDPLVECGIPVDGGWREMLPLMVGIKARLSCLERQIQQAEQEHKAFKAKFLVTVCCLVLVPVFGALLVGWTRARQTLARQQQQRQEEGNKQVLQKEANSELPLIEAQTCEEIVRWESCPLERRIIVVMCGGMTLDDLMTRKASYAHFAEDILGDEHVTGTLVVLAPPAAGVTVKDARRPHSQGQEAALECAAETQGRGQQDVPPLEDTAAQVEVQNTEIEIISVEDRIQDLPQQEAHPVTDQCPQAVPTPPEGAEDEEANRLVRRSLLVPRRFRERLEGPGECFLQYLRGHHSVMVFQDWPRGKLHIKGGKNNVLDCYAAVRTLLAEWRTREGAAE